MHAERGDGREVGSTWYGIVPKFPSSISFDQNMSEQ